jgi:hypothetical protein
MKDQRTYKIISAALISRREKIGNRIEEIGERITEKAHRIPEFPYSLNSILYSFCVRILLLQETDKSDAVE